MLSVIDGTGRQKKIKGSLLDLVSWEFLRRASGLVPTGNSETDPIANALSNRRCRGLSLPFFEDQP
jgi:hypothetical protein